MEIFTLLKANIRHKKGLFFSIIVLMVIIAMSLTAIISVKDNCKNSIQNELDQANAGNLTLYISNSRLTDNLLSSVKQHSMVQSVTVIPAICTDKTEIGNKSDTNTWFLLKQKDNLKMFNQELTAYEQTTPKLNKGEIYIPQGVITNLECNIGNKLTITALGEKYDFTIKGVVVEPVNGPSVMGWKQVFISDEDFEKIHKEVIAKESKERTVDFNIMQIYKTTDCTLSDKQFKRQLNLDTGIVDKSEGSMPKEMSMYYTFLFTDIISSILTVFIGFLIVIVLIVMGHSISTGIEMDYVNLGVLKAQGFSKEKIRLILLLQYVLAQITGTIIGFILAIPLIRILGNVFQPITAVLAENNISIGKSLLIILAILLISGIFIFFITHKVGKISPVRAISGGRSEIYFDSRIKAPISQKALSASLALRQFTSNKRRYTGTIAIISLLVFFMMTMNILSNVITSKSAVETMGAIYTECDITFKDSPDDKTLKEIEKTIEKYTSIDKKYYLTTLYFSINGEEYHCTIWKDPELIPATKGRVPLYDNEIIITDIVAEELNLNIGDKVTVSHNNKKETYIISGFYQSMNDTGQCFSMALTGAERLGINCIYYGGYSLSDTSNYKEIEKELNKKFGNILEANATTEGKVIDNTNEVAINAMKAVIYTFSVVFALVVVMMVCTKTFLQERKDIGIYKALGFTTGKLRLQFAVRFLIISIIGSAIGSLLSTVLSGKLLSTLLKNIGITNFIVDLTAETFILPISIICICFFLFSYFASGKIKRVEIKELVTE